MLNIAAINPQNKICSKIILKIDVKTNKCFNTSHDYCVAADLKFFVGANADSKCHLKLNMCMRVCDGIFVIYRGN